MSKVLTFCHSVNTDTIYNLQDPSLYLDHTSYLYSQLLSVNRQKLNRFDRIFSVLNVVIRTHLTYLLFLFTGVPSSVVFHSSLSVPVETLKDSIDVGDGGETRGLPRPGTEEKRRETEDTDISNQIPSSENKKETTRRVVW